MRKTATLVILTLVSLATSGLASPASAAPPAAEPQDLESFLLELQATAPGQAAATLPAATTSWKGGSSGCPTDWTYCSAEICAGCCLEWGGWTGSLCAVRDCLCWDA
jgi:hypothetical protein